MAYQLVAVVVSQGTEVIYLRYADSVTPEALANGTLTFRDVGVYGNQTEVSAKQNPRAISSVKQKIGTNLATYTYNPATVCMSTTCVWSLYIPVGPTAIGGQYALEVRAKKGDSLSNQTVYYQVYREALVEPIMVLMDSKNRVAGYDNYNVNVALLPIAYGTDTASAKPLTTFTTSSSYFTLRGVGVAGKKLKVTAVSGGTTFVLCSSVTVATSGIFTCNVDLVSRLKTLTGITAPVNYYFPNTKKEFLIQVETIPSVTGETVLYSKNLFKLIYDTTAPLIKDIKIDTISPNLAADDGNAFSADTRTLTGPMNGWVAPGGYADYYLTANKVLRYVDVTKESGYIARMTDLGNLLYKVRLIVDRAVAGYYSPTFLLVDEAGNKTTYTVNGNSLSSTTIIPGATITNAYSLQTDPAHTQFGKFVSVGGVDINDFRVYEDDQSTDPTEFALNGELESDYVYGDGYDGILADAGAPETSRLTQGFVTRANSVKLMGVAEEGTRVEIWVSKFGIVGSKKVATLQVMLSSQAGAKCYPIGNQVLAGDAALGAPSRVLINGRIVSIGQLVTKSNMLCEWSYDYVFTDDGANDAYGIPQHGYNFTARVIDHTGLATVHSTERTVWHDTASPNTPNTTNLPVITSSTTVTTDLVTERESDSIVNFSKVNESTMQLVEVFSALYRNDASRSSTQSQLPLGLDASLGQRDDSRAECIGMSTANQHEESGSVTMEVTQSLL